MQAVPFEYVGFEASIIFDLKVQTNSIHSIIFNKKKKKYIDRGPEWICYRKEGPNRIFRNKDTKGTLKRLVAAVA